MGVACSCGVVCPTSVCKSVPLAECVARSCRCRACKNCCACVKRDRFAVSVKAIYFSIVSVVNNVVNVWLAFSPDCNIICWHCKRTCCHGHTTRKDFPFFERISCCNRGIRKVYGRTVFNCIASTYTHTSCCCTANLCICGKCESVCVKFVINIKFS